MPINKYNNPVLVSSVDGVGTKLLIASLADKHDTIGQCLVNHCVNDILAVGAKPLYFLDYYAAGKLNIEIFEQVVIGLSKACSENSCALIGGETAEMPDFYQKGDYDISGTIIGVVDKDQMLTNRTTTKGDVLIGLPSTGLHTNGYSLARKVLLEHYSVDDYVESLGKTVGEALLSIHKSYLKSVSPILNNMNLVGISHITGGGIVENTARVIREDQLISIDWSTWERPPIFNLIQKLGNVPEDDMRRSMNLGVGMILIVKPEGLSMIEEHFNTIGEPYIHLGNIN